MKQSWLYILLSVLALPTGAQKILVQAHKPYAEVQPTMWGIFFEDINFSADGGIYAELVKNRSFEFDRPMMGWKEIKKGGNGRFLVTNRETNPNNPRYLKLTLDAATGGYGLQNEGFRGMGVKAGESYRFSVMLNALGASGASLQILLLNGKGETIGSAGVTNLNGDWKKYTASFKASETDAKASLQILFQGQGTVELDMVSLFPDNTWKGRPGGLRKDLVEKLAALKPGFIRFPGGCIVEGFDLERRYQWKTTVGNLEDRKLIVNRWNTEFREKLTPDYFQSFGLGFYEYFLLCEDLDAAPLPILNCGMACQYNSAEVVDMPQLDPYIQDALDLIEFANGDAGTKWGKLRSDMGHPAPFNMTMMGVGNEQWGPQYIERFNVFQAAIKKRYPAIKLVGATGPGQKEHVDYLSGELRKTGTELLDEHFYVNPEVFKAMATRYDNYPRGVSKIFVGEYAAHGKDDKDPLSKNTWLSALSEAAFMTGMERNADVVTMTSYAPLFAHTEAWQWRPNLIWFDNLQSVATPNYYVQQFFSTARGTHVVPVTANGHALSGADSLYASATIDKNTGETLIKLVNASQGAKTVELEVKGAKGKGSIQELTAASGEAFNSMAAPNRIAPATKALAAKQWGKLALKPMSVNLVRLK